MASNPLSIYIFPDTTLVAMYDRDINGFSTLTFEDYPDLLEGRAVAPRWESPEKVWWDRYGPLAVCACSPDSCTALEFSEDK